MFDIVKRYLAEECKWLKGKLCKTQIFDLGVKQIPQKPKGIVDFVYQFVDLCVRNKSDSELRTFLQPNLIYH